MTKRPQKEKNLGIESYDREGWGKLNRKTRAYEGGNTRGPVRQTSQKRRGKQLQTLASKKRRRAIQTIKLDGVKLGGILNRKTSLNSL